MHFSDEPNELARQAVAEWASGSGKGTDPFQRVASLLREGAQYHERLKETGMAELYGWFADFLESVTAEIRNVELDYDRAAEVSPYARGTIKNKKREGDGERGKVRVDALPLAPLRYPGVRAVRIVDLMKQEAVITEAEERLKAAGDESDTEWARKELARTPR